MAKLMKKKEELIFSCPFCGSTEVQICRTNEDASWLLCKKCGRERVRLKSRILLKNLKVSEVLRCYHG